MRDFFFGEAFLWREICVSKSIGLALLLEVNLPVLLCFTLNLRAIFQVQAPRGAYIWRGDLTEGFLCYWFGGLIFGGAYTWRGLFSEFYGMPKGQWLILCYCPIIGRGITNFLHILAILPSSLKCPPDIPREERRIFFRPFTFQER